MNVKYYHLYEERSGMKMASYIPIRENTDAWAVEGFVHDHYGWHYDTQLSNPEDWDEFDYDVNSYLKLIPMTEAPEKHNLIGLLFSNKL